MFSASMTSEHWPKKNLMLWSGLLIVGLSMLSACSSSPLKAPSPAVVSLSTPPAPVLPALSPIKTAPVEWKVLEVDDKAWFALDAASYEALALNLADTIRWVQEAAWQMDFYRSTRGNTGSISGDNNDQP